MSLATRISFFVMILLLLGGVGGSVTFYKTVNRSLNEEIDDRLHAQINWLESAIELDDDEERLILEGRTEQADSAGYWQVATAKGKVLWGFGKAMPADTSRTLVKHLSLGDEDLDVVEDDGIHIAPADDDDDDDEGDEDDEDAAEDDRAAEPDGISKPTNVNAVGLLEIDDGFTEWHDYVLAGEHRAQLVLTASVTTEPMRGELARLSTTLWTLVPAFVFITGLLLVLFVRFQLKPLQRMADQAQRIGPENVNQQLDSVGTTAEYVQLRESINAMLARLSDGLARERQFASAAAHELRTPLAQLRLGAELALRRERDKEDYRDTLEDVLRDVDRLENLIQGLLQLTRSDGARLAGKPVRVDALLQRVARDHAPVELAEDLHDPALCIDGDEQLLTTALGNVVVNAHRYAPDAPPVIDVRADNGQVCVTVADQGPGVPDSDRGRIFEPLTRLDQARTIGDRSDGFGLGLAIARATVRAFGGELVCKQRADGQPGSAFVFSLNVSESHATH